MMVFEKNRSGWFSKKNKKIKKKLKNLKNPTNVQNKLSCFKDYAIKKVNEN